MEEIALGKSPVTELSSLCGMLETEMDFQKPSFSAKD